MEHFTYVCGYWLFFIAFPVFTFCKILQALFPYVILGYLLYYDELFYVDLYQLVMLFTCIGLQFVLLILGCIVFRIQYWLWHIKPGSGWINLDVDKPADTLLQPIQNYYESRVCIPVIEKYLKNIYGQDIGKIIMDYYQNIQIDTV